jgi:hypothetical protein
MEKSFEILHLSVRHNPSYHDEGCYKLNLVFRVWDTDDCCYTKERFLDESAEWKKTLVVTDVERAERYLSGLRMINPKTGNDLLDDWKECKEEGGYKPLPVSFTSDSGLESEDIYITAYQHNSNGILTYNKKFDVFRFYEYFKINSVTDGIISYLRELQLKYDKDTYYAEQLLLALKSLEFWWD